LTNTHTISSDYAFPLPNFEKSIRIGSLKNRNGAGDGI
jgi:hypothetical protein